MRRVSVIVPTFDRPRMLREALSSIRSLEAEYDELTFEVIVGDNGLTDETRQACADFAAVYAAADGGRGASYARNAAMRLASGEFIAFLDDDDAWVSGHIRPHIAFLDENPHYDAVFGQAIYVDPEMNPLSAPWPEAHPGVGDDLLRAMLSGLFPQIGTLVARREVVAQIGYFDARLVGGQDLDWMLRIARRHKLNFVAAACIHFRSRPQGTADALQRRRIGFDRRVFLRHGLPVALRIWKTPVSFLRAYHSTLTGYYNYFIRRADAFIDGGQWGEALKALATSIINLPVLAAVDMVRPSELRTVIAHVFGLRRSRP